MKNTRKWLTLLLAAVLALSLSVPALAAETSAGPEEIAAAFMALLDQDGIDYDDYGIDYDGDYSIVIYYPGDHREEHEIYLYIDSSGLFFSAYEWYLLYYDGQRLDEVLETMNELNSEYRFVTFAADTSDDTITAKTYGVIQGDADYAASLLHYAYDYLPIIVDHAWEELTAGVPTVGNATAGDAVEVPVEEPVAVPQNVSMAGKWYFSFFEMESGGEKVTFTAEMLGTREFFVLTLFEDGTAEFATVGEDEPARGSWTQDGDTGALEIDGEAIGLTLNDDNTLKMDAMEEAGYVLTMVRDAA